jgi:signal transduction histidine kinase
VTIESEATLAPAGDAEGERRWRLAALAAVVLIAAFAAIPTDRVIARTVVYAGAELAAAGAVLAAIRHYRPPSPAAWRLLGGALLAWTVADALWGAYQAADREPFPSLADPFYLIGYAFIAAGLLAAGRARAGRLGVRTLIDPAIIMVVGGYAAYVYIIAPAIDNPDLNGSATALAVAYPVCDVALAGIAARMVFTEHGSERCLRLLVGAIMLVLAGDVIFATAGDQRQHSVLLADALLMAGALTIGLAAVHPSMTSLTAPHRGGARENRTVRVIAVSFTCAVVPVIVLIEVAQDESAHLGAALIASTALAILLVLRYAHSATSARQAAHRERVLSRCAAEMLAGGTPDDLRQAAERAAHELTGGAATVVAAGEGPPDGGGAVALPVDADGERMATLVVTDIEKSLYSETRTALAAVAAQLALALERQRLLAREQETARALQEQNERLRELDQMKGQFVSSVSHELRTPLTSIVGYMELLLGGEAGELNADQERFLQVMGRNCDRLTKLVDDILFSARVDAGRLSLDLQPVDLGEVAAATIESAGPVADAKGLELRLDVEPGIPPLPADPTRIGELLDNLLSNAIKFTPEGVVAVVVARDGDHAHLEVTDSGVGIPAAEVDKLFERFFRASTSSVAAGTGLGLSISKSIVEAHRGTISVRSTLGTGTTFLVDLPLQAPQRERAAATADRVSST